MQTDMKGIVDGFRREVFERGDFEAARELLAPGYRLHDLTCGKSHDREDLLEALWMALEMVRGVEVTVEEQLLAEGDRVVTSFTLRAARAATDGEEPVEVRGICISQLSGGRMEESRVSWDAERAERELRPPEARSFEEVRPIEEGPPPEEAEDAVRRTWWWPPWR